eukprot:tig00000157_g9728.t1
MAASFATCFAACTPPCRSGSLAASAWLPPRAELAVQPARRILGARTDGDETSADGEAGHLKTQQPRAEPADVPEDMEYDPASVAAAQKLASTYSVYPKLSEEVASMLKTGLGFSDEDCETVVQLCPRLAWVPPWRVAEVLDLLSVAGFSSRRSLKHTVLRGPEVLARSLDELHFICALVQGLGARTEAEFHRIWRTNPGLLTLNYESQVRPVLEILLTLGVDLKHMLGSARVLNHGLDFLQWKIEHLRDLGIDGLLLTRTLNRCPQAVEYWYTAGPMVAYLRELGCVEEDVIQIVYKYPRIVMLSTRSVTPKVAFLQGLGLRGDALVRTLRRWPQILSCSLEGKIVPALRALQAAGLARADLLAVIRQKPALLGLSVERRLAPRIEALRRAGFEGPLLTRVLKSAPGILERRLEETLPAKLAFLLERGYTLSDVAAMPVALTTSLERRVRPRLLFLEARGIRRGLSQVVPPTDAGFAERVARVPLHEGSAASNDVDPDAPLLHARGPDPLPLELH